jgi:AcrR family transcriptional regulator
VESTPPVMRIGELARQSGIRKELIHYYLRRNYLHHPVSKRGNQAYYDQSHLERLKFILRCKDRGTPLAYTVGLWEEELARNRGEHRKRQHGGEDSSTRKEIVEEASKAFLQKGYSSTTISEIVNRVNITKPAFYYYFRNKKDIYYACLDNIVQSFAMTTLDKIRNETDPLKRIQMRGGAAKNLSSELITIIHLIKESLCYEDGEQRRRAASILRRYWIDPLIRDLDNGVECGIFRPFNSEIIGFVLLSILETYSYRAVIDRNYSDEEIEKSAFDFILHGLLNKP